MKKAKRQRYNQQYPNDPYGQQHPPPGFQPGYPPPLPNPNYQDQYPSLPDNGAMFHDNDEPDNVEMDSVFGGESADSSADNGMDLAGFDKDYMFKLVILLIQADITI